jgi:hypothetical protein
MTASGGTATEDGAGRAGFDRMAMRVYLAAVVADEVPGWLALSGSSHGHAPATILASSKKSPSSIRYRKARLSSGRHYAWIGVHPNARFRLMTAR